MNRTKLSYDRENTRHNFLTPIASIFEGIALFRSLHASEYLASVLQHKDCAYLQLVPQTAYKRLNCKVGLCRSIHPQSWCRSTASPQSYPSSQLWPRGQRPWRTIGPCRSTRRRPWYTSIVWPQGRCLGMALPQQRRQTRWR